MPTHLALLRGINVGGNKKVSMLKLKTLFSSLGYKDVSTYINSGNVLFTTKRKDSETMIAEMETKMEECFGFQIRVVLRTAKSIRKVASAIPTSYTNDEEQKTDILFLWDPYDSPRTLKKIKTSTVDTLTYIEGAIIWNIRRKNYSKSGMHDFIGTEVYRNMTARNVNTIRTLAKMME